MNIKEITFDDVSHLRYNENDKDHRGVLIDDTDVFRVRVYEDEVRAVSPLTNGDLPLKMETDVRYFLIDGWGVSRNIYKDFEELQKFIDNG